MADSTSPTAHHHHLRAAVPPNARRLAVERTCTARRFSDVVEHHLFDLVGSYVVRFWLCSFLLLRIYLLYYDHEYSRDVSKNKWKILMNPALPRQNSWWMANRHHKYGDERWIICHVLVPSTAALSIAFVAARFTAIATMDILSDFYHPFYWYFDITVTVLWYVRPSSCTVNRNSVFLYRLQILFLQLEN